MRQVTVKREVLLERIKANREQHRSIFEDALKGYREAVIEALDKALADAKAGLRLNTHISLIRPEDHTRDYDLVIDMLENSVDETITLDADSYGAYMRDEWVWKRQWATSNAAYTALVAAPDEVY